MIHNENSQPFGNWVKERRHNLDLTQEELADRAGCATISIRRIEAGTLRPSVQLAEQLAVVLEISDEEKTDFMKKARSVANGNGIPKKPEPVSEGIDSRMWQHTEYLLTLLPLIFMAIVLIANPRYLAELAVIEPPFLIVNSVPCGWFVFALVLALMVASKAVLQNGRRGSSPRQVYYRTGLNGFVLLFMTFPALLLILLAPALFQLMRSGVLAP